MKARPKKANATRTISKRTGYMRVGLMHNPPHAGIILNEDFLKPLRISLRTAAKNLSIKYESLRLVVKGEKGISPSLATRLSIMFGNSPQFWLNMQGNYDLWHVMQSENKNLKKIKLIN